MSEQELYDGHYDVVIVGAGVGGATTAKIVADHGGKRILILEAGRNTGMSADKYQSHVEAYHEALFKVPNSPYADNPNVPQPSELSVQQLVPPPEPNKAPRVTIDTSGGYLVQTGPLGFASSYTRAFGGTTLHWLGTTLRMLPNDFNLHTKYGHGVDWPIEYEDVRPYYERAETEIIGVSANVEDQVYPGIDPNEFFRHTPGDDDPTTSYNFPMERIPSSYLDNYLADHIDGVEIEMGESPGDEIATVEVSNTPVGRNSTPRGDYRAVGAVGTAREGHRCEGNSSCIPICPVQAKYNALKTMAEIQRTHPAKPSGTRITRGKSSVTTITQAIATKVELGEDGRASGITYQLYEDEARTTFTEHTVTAKVYVLAAHAIENAKLLLASGASNSSGQVGRNLMDHPLILTWGLLPNPVWSYRGPGSTSGIPAFRDGDFRKRHSAFRVEIGNWGWNFAANAPYSTFEAMMAGGEGPKGTSLKGTTPMFGAELRDHLARVIPRQFRMAWEFEQIPQASNFITIDPRYRDRMGNYRPVIRYDLPDYVRGGMEAARNASRQVFHKLGLEPLYDADGTPVANPNAFPEGYDYTRYDESAPGYVEYRGEGYAWEGAGHVAGTHRMSASASEGVVDECGRSWDHKNLFLVGCGNMPTVGTSNPTLTMTALAIKTGEAIITQLRKGTP